LTKKEEFQDFLKKDISKDMTTFDYSGLKFRNSEFCRVDDTLTAEEALQININFKPFTLTMRTPGNDTELVRGLLFSEGVYSRLDKNPTIQALASDSKGICTALNLIINEDDLEKDFVNSRNLMSVSSCGMCGLTEFENPVVNENLLADKRKLNPELIEVMFDLMDSQQETFKKSGGSHAAAAFTINAEILDLKEDIGRHNAVDKVVGSLILKGGLYKAACLVVSGRISFEIISKSHKAGIPFLASVSAPSSMAVDFARKLGITLMAFCRNGSFTAYANEDRLLIEKE